MNCAKNIVTANFSGGKTNTTTAALWQWDYGQVICITGIEDLPAAFEVHFSTNKTGGVSTVVVGADGQVTIPNVLLTIGKNLNAWIYLSESEGEGETEYSILIPVKARPMPETYDAEVTGEFDDVVRQVSEYAQTAQTAADNAGASASAAATSASEAAASASSAAGSAGAAEQARADAVTAKGQAETAARTATENAQQTAQDAAQAAQSKADAESAAQRAEAAQTGAESAKTDAETAAQGAAASASAASASSTSAGQAASAAAGSASAAAQSAASIKGDVQTATQKAAEAQTAAGQAVTAKDAAVTAQTATETAATNAGQSASTATAKASEAATSASNAARSKTDAEAAATRAEQAAASLTVDSALSDTSTNPVQNKVITAELTDVKSAIHAVGEIPLVTYDGFVSDNGGIGNDDHLYLHTGKIPVEAGDVIGVQIHYTETKKLWLGYATYNAAGTFIARTVLLVNQNYTDYSGQFTVPSGASYVIVIYAGYGISTASIQRFASVKNAIDDVEALRIAELITNVGAYDCEVGAIYKGKNSALTTRCRTVGYIPVEPGAVFRIKSGEQTDFAVSTYNASKTFIADSGWVGKYTVNADTAYVRITMRRPDNSTIAAADVDGIAESVEYIRPDIWGAIEALDDYVPSATNEVGIVSKISDFACEVGSIYNGINSAATTRCRTAGYVPFNSGRIIVNGSNLYVVNCYDREKRHLGMIPANGTWSNADADINVADTCYIRVVMAKSGHGTIADADVADVSGSFQIVRDMVTDCFMGEPGIPSYFSTEVEDCRSKLDSYCTEKALVFAIVTDTHVYYDNKNVSIGWWKDTVRNIAAVNDAYQIDSLVHLGDMVNGSLPKATTLELIRGIRDDMRGIVQPNFILVGNHDTNTFYDNMSEPLTEAEMYAVWERYNEKDITKRPDAKPYWYKDYDSFGIRVIYLSSSMGDGTHGGQAENWGYPQAEVTWFTDEALNTDKQILLLSHMPFSQGYVSADASLPTNGNLMKAAVDAFIANGGVVCGLVHGHTHFDYVNNNGSFYEISHGAEVNTGNTANKVGTEIYSYAPASAVQYGRTYGTLTQDLWSILVVRPTSRTCKLIRFGAGEDMTWSY